MPSKTSFAILALLAASVSALPTRGYNDLYARGPDTPGAVADPNAVAAVPPPVGGPVNNAVTPGPLAVGSGTGSGSGTHSHQHQHNSQHPHPHPHNQHNQHNQHPGSGLSHPHHHNNDLSGSQRPRPVHRHTHSGDLSQMSSQGTVHHTGPHRQRRLSHDVSSKSVTPPTPVTPSSGSAGSGAGAVVPPTGQTTTMSRREFYENPELERRNLLQTLGLQARVASLTVKQTEKMSKAKTICGGLSSKKDQHTCHKTVDKIIQLTKERNYDVEQFIKVSNHHDVFTTSDPSAKSSSSSTSSST